MMLMKNMYKNKNAKMLYVYTCVGFIKSYVTEQQSETTNAG